MSLPVKLGVGTLALGSAVGVVYGAVNYFSEQSKETREGKSIKSLIDEKFEHILLSFVKGDTNTDEPIWKQNWDAYKNDNSSRDIDVLGVKGWTKDTKRTSTEELKARCEELSNLIVYEKGKANYESVTKYCGRQAKAGDEAIKNGLEIIKGEGEDPWKEKIAKKDKLTTYLTKLNITETGNALTSAVIKPKCEAAQVKNRKDAGYSSIYEAYKFVCTNHPIPE